MEGRKIEVGNDLEEGVHRKLKELKQVLLGEEQIHNLMTDMKLDEIDIEKVTGEGYVTVKNAWAEIEEKVIILMKFLAEGARGKSVVPDLGGESSKAEMKPEPMELEPPVKVLRVCPKGAKGNAALRNLNPLDLPEVRAKIFEYINNVEDMKSVRAVNKIWKDDTFHKWRSTAGFLINYETIPVLLKAFGEIEDFPDLMHLPTAEALARKDPFRLQDAPFKKYRFAKSQNWIYPLDEEDDLDRKLIWEKCINPNATYVDVGECILKACSGRDISPQRRTFYAPGLRWILLHSSQVTELALAPLVSDAFKVPQNGDGEDDVDRGAPQMEARPIWFDPTLEAPQVTTLTISSPRNKSGFKRFFGIIQNTPNTETIFHLLPNLKSLKLPSNNLDSFIIFGGLASTTFNAEDHVLENLNALDVEYENATSMLQSLQDYLHVIADDPTLRELKLAVSFKDCIADFEYENSDWCPDDLRIVGETLNKLEFRVDGHWNPNKVMPANLGFYFGTCSFPNLTHFKVQLDYKKFYGRLSTFDFTNLKRMPSLREFYFGSKKCVERSWVVQKLNLVEPHEVKPEQSLENYEMADLKSFHFHGNLKKEGIQQLGRITRNLETLELVFDRENWLVVKDIWPRLKNLKVLPCSSVPEEVISELKESHSLCKVEDESNNWYPADWVVINAEGTSDSDSE